MAKAVFLEFEKDLGEIAAKIEKLEAEELDSGKSNRDEIAKLEKLKARRTAEIYHDLTPWQTALVARHPNRPYTMDYINTIFEDFHELHGDRTFADDQSIVGGLARLAEHAVMVIGHQKGRDTRERTRRNFGMSKPEGYRKALRLMKLAEKFNLPVFTFVDTPGAYPGIDAEERNQSEAIGRNIFELTKLKVPVIATIIGEGGSGGALAIAVADAVFMLQYATYSVISPEGCASILWKSAAKASEAAQALGLTADRLKKLGLVDKVISEPIGGAHSDPKLMASTLKKALVDQLKIVKSLTVEELLERRLDRLLSYGRFECEGPHAAVRIATLFGDDPTEAEAAVKLAVAAGDADTAASAAPAGAEAPAEAASQEKPAKRRTTRKKTQAKGQAPETGAAAAAEKAPAASEASDAAPAAPAAAESASEKKPVAKRTTAAKKTTKSTKTAAKSTLRTRTKAAAKAAETAEPAEAAAAAKPEEAVKTAEAAEAAEAKKPTAKTATKAPAKKPAAKRTTRTARKAAADDKAQPAASAPEVPEEKAKS